MTATTWVIINEDWQTTKCNIAYRCDDWYDVTYDNTEMLIGVSWPLQRQICSHFHSCSKLKNACMDWVVDTEDIVCRWTNRCEYAHSSHKCHTEMYCGRSSRCDFSFKLELLQIRLQSERKQTGTPGMQVWKATNCNIANKINNRRGAKTQACLMWH